MGRRSIPWRLSTFIPKDIGGISPGFPGLFLTKGYVTYVLLTRAPLYSCIATLSRTTCMFEACR